MSNLQRLDSSQRPIVISPRAETDLKEQFAYIARSNFDAALRFFEAVRATLDQLAEMPALGSVRKFDNPALAGIRQWPVPGFRKYLIFYRATESGIEVVRVLHSARDIESAFADEED